MMRLRIIYMWRFYGKIVAESSATFDGPDGEFINKSTFANMVYRLLYILTKANVYCKKSIEQIKLLGLFQNLVLE